VNRSPGCAELSFGGILPLEQLVFFFASRLGDESFSSRMISPNLERHGFTLHEPRQGRCHVLGTHEDESILDQEEHPRSRQEVNYSFDRDKIIELVLGQSHSFREGVREATPVDGRIA
jgi:hypothetical protein